MNESTILSKQTVSAIDPHYVLEDFFEWYSLENAAEELDLLITVDPKVFNMISEEQNESQFFSEKLKTLLAAAWQISQRTQEADA